MKEKFCKCGQPAVAWVKRENLCTPCFNKAYRKDKAERKEEENGRS